MQQYGEKLGEYLTQEEGERGGACGLRCGQRGGGSESWRRRGNQRRWRRFAARALVAAGQVRVCRRPVSTVNGHKPKPTSNHTDEIAYWLDPMARDLTGDVVEL